MRLVSPQQLCHLQNNPKAIRNICIVAHVDHGKTTLADSLVASNGIISPKLAGKLRYMDSRKDEQERGITMKSSSIALLYNQGEENFLVNLIDSPGHVDFSSEVSTAVRLCDGAVVVVDVVEGVCPQTKVALKQAWMENIKPVLILNKIDRLILEVKLSPLDAFVHLTQVLEQVNAFMGELLNTEVLGRNICNENPGSSLLENKKNISDWSAGLEDVDDSNLYFSPEQGNVVFASAVDGWGFGIQDFAKLFAKKLGIDEKTIHKCLWGDFYYHSKTKQILKGAQEKAKKPLFVQFVLENLWAVYETIIVRKDKEKMLKMLDTLNIQLSARDLRHTDGRVQLQAVCSQWLPLAKSVLEMVCIRLPSPCEISEEKAEKLMCSHTERFDTLPMESQTLKEDFVACSSGSDAPVIVFISKMFPVEKKSLPQNKPKPLTPEEIAQRREQAKKRIAEMQNKRELQEVGDTSQMTVLSEDQSVSLQPERYEDAADDVFVAFARVFSGTLKKGQELFVLGPKHDPREALEKLQNGDLIVDPSIKLKDLKSGEHITKVVVENLYLLMGRELELIQEAPAGNIIGIGGLEDHVLKSATLSTTIACPAFTELSMMAVPIVRVAVEPKQPQELPALVRGLRLLNQADACVQVIVQETGEHVIVTAGEVHLERCLKDLQERYAKIDVIASKPIVPFRETIVESPVVDMVNEAIQDQTLVKKISNVNIDTDNADGLIAIKTANKQSTIKIRAVPLPPEITNTLENNSLLLKAMDRDLSSNRMSTLTDRTVQAISELRALLSKQAENAGPDWKDATSKIWSFGPRRCGPNILVNNISNYQRQSVWEHVNQDSLSQLSEYDSSFINGFQLATLAGPLCEEPMMGVCFIIEDWVMADSSGETTSSQPFGPFSGQIMSAVREGCRKAFQAQPQRLMAAMYNCNIQVNAEALGKMYAVLGRRHGRVLEGDMTEGSTSFVVSAALPVVESFAFAAEIRKQTSGLASPQLVFSHWEVIDIDPFWTPSTEEEYLHFGEKADSENRARKYMNDVRKRKGLAVEEKIVEFAEKQRTLSKKK